MATAVSINLSLPRADIGFVKKMAQRMGWSITPAPYLYDPECGRRVNAETLQAIEEIERGKTFKCKNLDELLATL